MSVYLVRMTDHAPSAEQSDPPAAWVQTRCPVCGAPVVKNTYWHRGRTEYRLECWHALDEAATCAYTVTVNALGLGEAP